MKYLFAALLMLITGSSAQVQAQVEDSDILRFEAGYGLMRNLKFDYNSYRLRVASAPCLWKKRMRIVSDIEGYRAWTFPKDYQGFTWAEYVKGKLELDLTYQHMDGAWQSFLQPHGGLLVTWDISKWNKVPTRGFYVSPLAGADYILIRNRWRIGVENTLTFYLDGLWVELMPAVSYDVWKGIHLRADFNTVTALTYGGKSSFGMYPGLAIRYHPIRQ